MRHSKIYSRYQDDAEDEDASATPSATPSASELDMGMASVASELTMLSDEQDESLSASWGLQSRSHSRGHAAPWPYAPSSAATTTRVSGSSRPASEVAKQQHGVSLRGGSTVSGDAQGSDAQPFMHSLSSWTRGCQQGTSHPTQSATEQPGAPDLSRQNSAAASKSAQSSVGQQDVTGADRQGSGGIRPPVSALQNAAGSALPRQATSHADPGGDPRSAASRVSNADLGSPPSSTGRIQPAPLSPLQQKRPPRLQAIASAAEAPKGPSKSLGAAGDYGTGLLSSRQPSLEWLASPLTPLVRSGDGAQPGELEAPEWAETPSIAPQRLRLG